VSLMRDMDSSNDIREVRWASRVNPSKIRRLYEMDARGILDEELIDQVGFALYSRCQSILTATEAHAGRVKCPRCGTVIVHNWDREAVLQCGRCSWRVKWGDYLATYQDRHLHGGGALDAFSAYITRFEQAHSPHQRMIAIDCLIHAFHWELVKDPGRSAAINLIYGKNAQQVFDFLNNLTYGEASSPEIQATKQSWDRKLALSQRRKLPTAPIEESQR
jgi:ribosomal protein S27AE